MRRPPTEWSEASANPLVLTTCEPFALGQDVCLLRPRTGEYIPEFFWFQLRSPQMKAQLGAQLIGATFKRINVDAVKSFRMLAPTRDVQREVVDYLMQKYQAHTRVKHEVAQCAGLLRERRSALITAAVTGQIDVRSWRPPDDWTAPEVPTA